MVDKATMRHLASIAAVFVCFTLELKSDEIPKGISTLSTPWVIPHRGGCLLWPEHTMEAYRASVKAGSQFVEVDCIALRDGSVIVMHDSELGRTTTGNGSISAKTARDIANIRVDGRRLLGSPWQQYHIPYLEEVLVKFGNQAVIFAEPKNGPFACSALIKKLKEYRISPNYVIINAANPEVLKLAKASGYKTCLNLSDMSKSGKALKNAGYWGVTCPYPVTKEYIQSLKAEGLKVIAYTINRQYERDIFLDWGIDGFFTDDPIYLDPSGAYRRNSDPYRAQTWTAGMLAGVGQTRGRFVPPDKWAVDASTDNTYMGCLQGWLSPIGGKQIVSEWSMRVSVTFGQYYEEGRWASISVISKDVPLSANLSTPIPSTGFHILLYNNGELAILRHENSENVAPTFLKGATGAKISVGETVDYIITTKINTLVVERVDGRGTLAVEDNSFCGTYVTFGAKGQNAEFSKVQLTIP